MPRRHLSSRRSFPRERRQLVWATVDPVQINIAAVGDFVTIDLLAAYKGKVGFTLGTTIMRTHLLTSVISAVAAANLFEYGIVVGMTSQVGANIAGAPNPAAGQADQVDWMHWSAYTSDTNGFFSPIGQSNVLQLDNKSKRKMDELQQTYIYALSAQFVSTYVVSGRILLALP